MAITVFWPVLSEVRLIRRICAHSGVIYAAFYEFISRTSLCWFDQVLIRRLTRLQRQAYRNIARYTQIGLFGDSIQSINIELGVGV